MKFIKNKIAIYSLNKNYLELHKYLATLLNEKPSYHPEMQKFLLWQNYIAAYYLKKIDTNYCLTELSLLLRKTTIGMDVLLDLQIKNSIANIYSENKRYTESTKIFQEILNTDFKTKEGDKLKIKVFYNFGKMLFLKKEFENSLFQTDRGIDLSIEMADMSLLGQFYYQKGAIMEELSFQFEEIASYYQRAHFFFDLIGLEFHSKIIIEKKGTFLVSKI
ncbi:hypothetical protein [Planomicrobium okeanokoites]|uniref:hypothetical protein n=1 Tax=Planomicrobium okeanokoites TaxID=244 RepID=UPI002467F8D4|nr:hypothetical protein [Planomicrobium okeanokoites]